MTDSMKHHENIVSTPSNNVREKKEQKKKTYEEVAVELTQMLPLWFSCKAYRDKAKVEWWKNNPSNDWMKLYFWWEELDIVIRDPNGIIKVANKLDSLIKDYASKWYSFKVEKLENMSYEMIAEKKWMLSKERKEILNSEEFAILRWIKQVYNWPDLRQVENMNLKSINKLADFLNTRSPNQRWKSHQ